MARLPTFIFYFYWCFQDNLKFLKCSIMDFEILCYMKIYFDSPMVYPQNSVSVYFSFSSDNTNELSKQKLLFQVTFSNQTFFLSSIIHFYPLKPFFILVGFIFKFIKPIFHPKLFLYLAWSTFFLAMYSLFWSLNLSLIVFLLKFLKINKTKKARQLSEPGQIITMLKSK